MTKSLICRTHGGKFTVESKRGRPPVRCTPDNPCSELSAIPREKRRVLTTEEKVKAVKAAAKDLSERIEVAKARVNTAPNPSALKAHEARYRLEPLGWQVTGRAWREEGAPMAEITAVRGEETLMLKWIDGVLVDQHYSVWDVDKPSANNKPVGKLPFDTDEMPDRKLVQAISGMKVTWWNALGQSEETAIIPGTKVVIEHAYSGIGDETPADRIIKFVDVAGSGFRAFRVGALLKIGK